MSYKIWIAPIMFCLVACGNQSPDPIADVSPQAQLAPDNEGELTGEVFVVTRGGQNIKLGLVTVTAIPEDVINEFLDERNAVLDRERGELEQRVHAKTVEIDATKTLYAAAQDEAETEYQVCLGTDATRPECRKRRDRALAPFENKLAGLRAEVSRAKEMMIFLETSRALLVDLPPGISSAKTNSDGRFSLQLPTNGRYVLSASASRDVLGSTEKYEWLVWASLEGKKSAHIMLANDNLTTAGSPDSLVALPR